MKETILRLREAEEARQAARRDQAAARREVQRLIKQAREEGMTVVAIAEATGISRENLHQLLRQPS
jgi:hypothetical protein